MTEMRTKRCVFVCMVGGLVCLLVVMNSLFASGNKREASEQPSVFGNSSLGVTQDSILTFLGRSSFDNHGVFSQGSGGTDGHWANAPRENEDVHSTDMFTAAPLANQTVEEGDAFPPSQPWSASSSCTNIAGTWYGSETVNLCCTVQGYGTECDSETQYGTIIINQSGCNIQYSIDGYPRTGTISGNTFQVSGVFAVPGVYVVAISQNSFTAQGTVNGNTIVANGYGIVSGTACCDDDGSYVSFSCTAQDTANLTRRTPLPADLIAPSGHITTTKPTYTWSAVSNATSYYLWVKDKTGNKINQSYTAAQAGCAGGTGTCAVTPDIALAECSANWWIRTANSYGNGPWSDGMAFSVLGPGKTTLISPSGTIDSQLPTYTWNADSHSTWYLLWVNDSTGNRINKWYTAAQAGCSGGTGTCAVTPPTTLTAGSTTWWIQTWSEGCNGLWSDGMGFTVQGTGKATLISPSGTISTTGPTYTWNADSYSTYYLLWVNDSTGNRINKWYTAAQAGCAGGTGICAVTPEPTLAKCSARWWIQTWGPRGYGPWSDGMAFTVQGPGKTTLVSPSGTISTTVPTYTWNADAYSTWYLLWVDDGTKKNKIKTWYTAAQAGCSGGAGTCAVTPPTTLIAGSYTWWIQTWSADCSGAWSDGMAFTLK
jgi:hypothetical protein